MSHERASLDEMIGIVGEYVEKDEQRARDKHHKKPNGGGTTQILPPPSAPMDVARQFVEDCCLHNCAADELTLRHWRGSFWQWQTTHWVEAEDRTIRSLLYTFTERASYEDEKGTKPWLPNRKKIGDLLEALSACVILPDGFEQPCWIDSRQTGPIVAVKNGLLDIATLELYDHSPMYFGQISVPFPYDPNAPEPTQGIDFLNELWPEEPEAIDALQEWYGYVLSGKTDLHKMLLTVGPTRGGKGIISRIERRLIGEQNACGPTLKSLGGTFGKQQLLNKSLAVIGDLRAAKNASDAVELLLSISGEDALSVERKFKAPYFGKLPVRFHIMSNELPRLPDSSTAIVGRFVLLHLTRSWLGKEDHELESNLCTELTGIMNWALDGLRRLTVDNGNHFTRVLSAEQAITTMRDLASPVGAFVRERCVLDPEETIGPDAIYEIYKSWCQENEYPKFAKHVFGRDLFAACASVRKKRPSLPGGGKGPAVYEGIGLRWTSDDVDGG
jgi:putative DNA primase/helicase